MANKSVSGYFVRHRITDAKSFLTIHFSDGGFEVIDGLDVNHAGYLIDLLRNEKPLTYDTASKILATASQEPVGEGE